MATPIERPRMMLGISVFSCVALLFGGGAIAAPTHQDAVDFVESQLFCDGVTAITPTPFLLYLANAGFISIKQRYHRADSTSCWTLRRPFLADGLPITGVCAVETTPLLMDQYPALYRWDPGVGSNLLGIFTSANLVEARGWANRNIVADGGGVNIDAAGDDMTNAVSQFPPSFKYGTMIECDDLIDQPSGPGR